VLVCVVLSLCVLAVVPAFAYENDDEDDFQAVASRLDNKLKSLEIYNAEAEDDDNNNNNADEDQDDNVAQDDNGAQEDEVDNTASAELSSAKVIRDVAALEEKVKSSSLSFSTRTAVKENLEAIKKDAQMFAQKTGARRQALAEAMADRMQALRMQLEPEQADVQADEDNDNEEDASNLSSNSGKERALEDISAIRSSLAQTKLPSSVRSRANRMLEDISSQLESGASPRQMLAEARQLHQMISSNDKVHNKHNRQFEEEEAKVNKISRDISVLEQSLVSSNLPSDVLTMAKDNLAVIQRDSESFAHAQDSTHRARLSQAIKLRMKALNIMLKQASQPASTHSFEAQSTKQRESRVLNDVQQLEETISKTHMNAHKKHEVMSNLEAIKSDAEKLSHASTSKAEHLKGAMELRMKALKMQLKNM